MTRSCRKEAKLRFAAIAVAILLLAGSQGAAAPLPGGEPPLGRSSSATEKILDLTILRPLCFSKVLVSGAFGVAAYPFAWVAGGSDDGSAST